MEIKLADVAYRSAFVAIVELDGFANGLPFALVRYPNYAQSEAEQPDSPLWVGFMDGKHIVVEPDKNIIFINGEKQNLDGGKLRWSYQKVLNRQKVMIHPAVLARAAGTSEPYRAQSDAAKRNGGGDGGNEKWWCSSSGQERRVRCDTPSGSNPATTFMFLNLYNGRKPGEPTNRKEHIGTNFYYIWSASRKDAKSLFQRIVTWLDVYAVEGPVKDAEAINDSRTTIFGHPSKRSVPPPVE